MIQQRMIYRTDWMNWSGPYDTKDGAKRNLPAVKRQFRHRAIFRVVFKRGIDK